MKPDPAALAAFPSVYLSRLRDCLDRLPEDRIAAVLALLSAAHDRSARLFIAGNGGSASTATHMACDLTKTVAGRDSRACGFSVTSLGDNVALLTAWANDAGYEAVFAEQLRAQARAGDVLIVISASGASPNVLAALTCAKGLGLRTIGLLGFGGGPAADLVDAAIVVDSDDYGIVEDAHLALNHVITGYFQRKLGSEGDASPQ